MDIHQIFLAATEAVQRTTENLPEAAAAVKEAASSEQNGGVLGTLGVNWKLFLAQLVNFGIVLFVFWKWVVKPLGKTLTDRQEKIESGLKNADYMEQEKRSFEVWRSEEMKKARAEADRIIKETMSSAEKAKNDTVVLAQVQASKILEQTKASIKSEKDQMMIEVKSEIATLVVSASEKILRSKLDSKRDQELIHDTIKSIK